MKKSLYFMAAGLGLLFTACADDTSDLGVMQKNEAPDIAVANGVAATTVLGSSIDLNNYQNINLPILDVAINKTLPETAIVAGTLQVSNNPDFAVTEEGGKVIDIPYTSTLNESGESKAAEALEGESRKFTAFIEGNLWENAFIELYGNRPVERVNYVRYNVFVQDGTQSAIIPYSNGEEWWPTLTMNVTPVDQKLDIAPSYTLVYGPANTPLVMTHSDQFEWDDPVFSAVIRVSEEEAAAGCKWQIQVTGNAAKAYGPATDATAFTGRVEEGKTGVIDRAGDWKIEVNMRTRMYSISIGITQLYVVNRGNNNSFTRNCQTLVTDNFINYSGMTMIYGAGFGLTSQPNFNGTNFFRGETDGTIAQSSSKLFNDDNCILAPKSGDGLYYMEANLVQLTYTTLKINTLGIVGGNNNWGNENADGTTTPDAALTTNSKNSSNRYTLWKGTVTFSDPDNLEFKVRGNGIWDIDKGGINFGGSADNLTVGGGNLSVPEVGTYEMEVSFTTRPYTLKFTKK